ncbi:MAG: PAS domain S-box protein [Acidobacteria bacterium]|nr:PAS domain S-box protein [Acidobacteriota bacterium]
MLLFENDSVAQRAHEEMRRAGIEFMERDCRDHEVDTLRSTAERYRRTLENAPIGIAEVAADGRIAMANAQFRALLGRSADEIVGHHFTEFLAPADVATALEAFQAAVDGWTPLPYQRQYIRPDGTVSRGEVALSPAMNVEGNDGTVIVLVKDVTERFAFEEELRIRKQQLDDAQQTANIGSWQRDFVTGRITWSDNLMRMYGFTSGDQLEPEMLYEMVHPDDRERVRVTIEDAFGSRSPFSVQFRVTLADGALHTLQAVGRMTVDPEGRPQRISGILQDITARVAGEEELRRVAVQQAAVANLSQIALIGASLESLFKEVSGLVCSVLNLDLCEVLQKDGDGFVIVDGCGWHEGTIGRRKVRGARGSQASFTLEHGQPVVVADIAHETRFQPSDVLLEHSVVSGVTVPIATADGVPWGVLGAHATTRRFFTTTDVDFLRSVAGVLGQAIERARVDAEVRARAAQQSAIAELGRMTLSRLDDETLDRACNLLARGLGIDYCVYAELDEEQRVVRATAGRWSGRPPVVREVAPDTQAGLCILTGKPVLVDDYATETRFRAVREAIELGLVSAATIPVASATRTHGVLAAQSRTRRRFTDADLDYLASAANLLAEAMEREAARRALVDSEERFRSVVEGATEIIFTVGVDGTIVSLNPAFEAITGAPVAQWVGRHFMELIEPADRRRTLGICETMLETLAPAQLEVTLALENGRHVLLDVSTFPRVKNGAMVELYGFARDITEARRAEAERQELTRSLQMLLQSTVEGIYTIDPQGVCTMVNAAAVRMFGRSARELVGRNVHELVHARYADGTPHPESDCPIFHIVKGGEATIASDVFWRADGTAMPVDYSAAPILDEGVVVGAVVAFTDATERRKLELKLEQADRLSSLGRLAATIAHEFNNVLMGISPFVEVIRRRPERAEFALDQVGRAVKRGKRITEDILRFTQPAAPARSVFAVEPWLQTVLAEARTLLPPECTLVLEPPDASLQADADSNQLHQIFTNLLLNARDAMPGGGQITLSARREPAGARFPFGVVAQPERFVHFALADTGSGMPPETLRHIFEPLFTTKPSGTGLGLTVTHQVVHRHGGEIFVESEPSRGTTFHIFIPLAEATAEAEMPAAPEPARERRRNVHVLLVEDDITVGSGLVSLLTLEGLEVDLVGTGHSAIDYLSKKRPDVVVLDVGLPDLDGTKVYEIIASMHPTLPVVFSTGHADRARIDDLAELDRSHVSYLLKPYDAVALLDTIASVMNFS